jgi:hypothetical protein
MNNQQSPITNQQANPDLALLDVSPALAAEIGRLVFEMLRRELQLERQKQAGAWPQPTIRR